MNPPRFPEYGAESDVIGARRRRRSFQLITAGIIFAALAFYLADRYFSVPRTEALYRDALTLPEPSARPLLRAAVQQDAESEGRPSARYLWALAEREEADNVLARYEEAYELDPANADLGLRYGCQLMLAGKFDEARDVFHAASVHDPENALPAYQEAAALALSSDAREDLAAALALVAQVNNSGRTVQFPEPLWFEDMPQGGYAYNYLQRRIIDECTQPIKRFVQYAGESAREGIEAGRSEPWEVWITALQSMGRRFLAAEPRGALPIITGLNIEAETLQLREMLAQYNRLEPSEALVERRMQLNAALSGLADFEQSRGQFIESNQDAYEVTVAMAAFGGAVFVPLFMLLAITAWLFRPPKECWAIPHTRAGIAGLVLAGAAMLGMLLLAAVLQRTHPFAEAWPDTLFNVWQLALLLLGAWALIYPNIALPAAASATAAIEEPYEREEEAQHARRERRRAYLALAHRYAGMLMAVWIMTVCVFGIGYRAATAFYPFQYEVLVTGMETEERALVEDVLQLSGIQTPMPNG